jgi:hypothetical protein
MNSIAGIFRRFCHYFIVSIMILLTLGCQPAFPEVEPAWITFTNQEYGYEFNYPSAVRVDVIMKDASQVKVHVEPGDPFQLSVITDHSSADVFYYLDTSPIGERKIGDNVWFEFVLPDGYCDAGGCSSPLYALQMEWGDTLYVVTFFAQDTMTELQEEILATFKISDKP